MPPAAGAMPPPPPRSARRGSPAVAAAAVILLRLHRCAAADLTLACQANTSPGVLWLCSDANAVAASLNNTYQIAVDADSAAYNRYDINVTLTSATGDADLAVLVPVGSGNKASTNQYSTYNTGPDIVFIYRNELAAGEYEVVVLGYAATTNYILTVEFVQTERELRPQAILALGQMFLGCCGGAACPQLKALHPELADNDPDTNPNYCYMHGNVCTLDGFLQELAMEGTGLACDWPLQQLQIFKHLQRLDLSNNMITGNMSDVAWTVAQMSGLRYLDLGYNLLDGALDQACNLTSSGLLAELNLRDNNLMGMLLPCILEAPLLQELHLDFNTLSGTIPDPNPHSPLVYFTAAYQEGLVSGLAGTVPGALGALGALTYLDLAGNMLTGTLPAGFAHTLRNLRLEDNYLEGSIPAAYGQLQDLRAFEMANNQLQGSLPAGLAALPALKALDVSNNGLTGSLPSDWTPSHKLAILSLQGNKFTGTVPASLANVETLAILNLSANSLSGDLVDFAFQTQNNRNDMHSRMRYFNAANNSLSGDLNAWEGLKDLGIFGISVQRGYSGLQAPIIAYNDTASAVQQRVVHISRTFILANNNLAGPFPGWLVERLAEMRENITIGLQGNVLVCPSGGFKVDMLPLPGVLDGLTCYQAPNAIAVTGATPLAQVASLVKLEQERGLSGGAIAGIVIAVLVAVGAAAAAGYWWWARRRGAGGLAFTKFDTFAGGAAVHPSGGNALHEEHYGAKYGGASFTEPGRPATAPRWDAAAEVEMGDPHALSPRAQSATNAGQKVSLKSGKGVQMP